MLLTYILSKADQQNKDQFVGNLWGLKAIKRVCKKREKLQKIYLSLKKEKKMFKKKSQEKHANKIGKNTNKGFNFLK